MPIPDTESILMAYIAMILLVVAIVFLVISRASKRAEAKKDYSSYDTFVSSRVARRIGSGVLVLATVFALLSVLFVQDPGQAIVVKSVTGSISGQTTSSGLHIKSPLDTLETYSTRNNTLQYIKDGKEDYSGGSATGNQITVQVSNGATVNIDVSVRYSIIPDRVSDIYKTYGPEENFVRTVIQPTVRSVVRDVPSTYTAVGLVTNRSEAAIKIQDELQAQWKPLGLQVDGVNLQEIRFSDDVTNSFNASQAATNLQEKARADQKTAQINAETAVITAQGQADANAKLTQSLTPEVLQQHYIDALQASGKIFVVPSGSSPLIQVPTP